jgi:hypothetical protein
MNTDDADSIQTPDFTYQPLKTPTMIRVLILEPGVGYMPLTGELKHMEISQPHNKERRYVQLSSQLRLFGRSLIASGPLQYEALSYVWGEPVYSRSIRCSKGRIALTPNLEEALLHIRFPDRRRVIWADAICVNQSDLQERSQQVRLMGDIYRNAEKVLIWLGPDYAHVTARQTFNALRELIRPPHLTGDDQKIQHHMEEVAKSKWFTRLWVVQELLLARRAVALWGNEELDFIYLRAPWNKWFDKPGHDFPRWCVSRRWTFKDSLVLTSDLHCSDPRDRIYALLNLHQLGNEESTFITELRHIIPDYGKPVKEVFCEMAHLFVRSDEAQGLLSQVDHHSQIVSEGLSLPSWVPDWSCSVHCDPLPSPWRWGFGSASAGLVFVAPEADTRSCILALKGFSHDEIRYTSSEDLLLTDVTETIYGIVSFWHHVIKAHELNYSKEAYMSLEESLFQTLIFRHRIHPERQLWEDSALLFLDVMEASDTRTEHLQTLAREILGLIISSSSSLDDPTIMLERGDHTCQRYWRNRKLFMTRKGCLGLGPSVMLPGDTLAICSGIGNPAIIRRTNGSHDFVGMAYVPSISSGEAVVEWKGSSAQLESFKLQ